MRWWTTLLVVTTAACAHAGTRTESDLEPPPEPPPTVEATGDGYMIRLSRADGLAVATFDAGQVAVFQALLDAFDALELPINGADPNRAIVQTGPVRAVRRLAGERMSEMFHCGQTLTGDRADTWRLEIEISAQVQPEPGDRSRLTTRVTAFARPIDGTSTNPVTCSTRGRLEQLLAERIAELVAD